MSDDLRADLRERLDGWRRAGLRRELAPPAGRDFSSSDYLGLSQHPAVRRAAVAAIRRDGAGAPSARLLRGHLEAHAAAERAAAEWLGSEAALLLPSGYQANLALLTTLPQAGDVLLSDALNHASLIDACRLSRAAVRVFEHNDLEGLERLLQESAAETASGRRWIVTERVFSMDGDAAPVANLLELCARHDAWLLLDEAHAAGVLPVLPAHPRLASRVITGGKALGVAGAFVAGSHELIELLVHGGRAFVFTTASPPATAAALEASIATLQREPARAERALANAEYLRSRLRDDVAVPEGAACIVPLVLGDAERTVMVARSLQAAGWDIRAVRPPTVPDGTSRLRITCHADHSTAELDALAEAIGAALQDRSPARPTPELRTGFVVAGTDTEVGKTIASALAVLELQRRGTTPRYLKPIQTGDDCDTTTIRRLTGIDAAHAPPPPHHFALPASPDQAAAAEGRTIDPAAVLERTVTALTEDTTTVIECAGGLRVPWTDDFDQLNAIEALQLPVLLAARSGLGTLNHTLLSLDALADRGIEVLGILLIGPHHEANEKSLRVRCGDTPICSVPHFDSLDRDTLRAWIDERHLDALPL